MFHYRFVFLAFYLTLSSNFMNAADAPVSGEFTFLGSSGPFFIQPENPANEEVRESSEEEQSDPFLDKLRQIIQNCISRIGNENIYQYRVEKRENSGQVVVRIVLYSTSSEILEENPFVEEVASDLKNFGLSVDGLEAMCAAILPIPDSSSFLRTECIFVSYPENSLSEYYKFFVSWVRSLLIQGLPDGVGFRLFEQEEPWRALSIQLTHELSHTRDHPCRFARLVSEIGMTCIDQGAREGVSRTFEVLYPTDQSMVEKIPGLPTLESHSEKHKKTRKRKN